MIKWGVTLFCSSCPVLDAWGGQKPQAGNQESLMTFIIIKIHLFSEYYLCLQYTEWYFHTN